MMLLCNWSGLDLTVSLGFDWSSILSLPLGHTQVKTTQRYAHLSHETLLAATNSVNTALGGVFVPMVSASPAAQVQLVQ